MWETCNEEANAQFWDWLDTTERSAQLFVISYATFWCDHDIERSEVYMGISHSKASLSEWIISKGGMLFGLTRCPDFPKLINEGRFMDKLTSVKACVTRWLIILGVQSGTQHNFVRIIVKGIEYTFLMLWTSPEIVTIACWWVSNYRRVW